MNPAGNVAAGSWASAMIGGMNSSLTRVMRFLSLVAAATAPRPVTADGATRVKIDTGELEGEDEAAGKAATAYWVAFARSGDPSTAGPPKWPRYASDTDQILDFTPTGPVAKADPRKARLELVEGLATKGTR